MYKKITSSLRYFLGIKTPIKVAHYITYRCNLQCDMCGRRFIKSEKDKELSTENAIGLQKEFRKHGTLVWSFSGGECLLRDDIIDLSKSVKSLGMDLIIVTNGILLPQKKDIVKYADIINISIDGNEATHDKLRGAGSYKRTLEGINALNSIRKRKLKVVIQTIINNETVELPVLEHLLKLAKEFRTELSFNPVILHRSDIRELAVKKYFPTYEQFKTLVNWLEEKCNSSDSGYLVDDPAFFKSIGKYPDSPKQIKCYGGIYQCSLDPFGKVLPCSDFFDFEEKYNKEQLEFEYGYQGFKNLKKPHCPYLFCCTAKKNYFFARPFLILKKYAFKIKRIT